MVSTVTPTPTDSSDLEVSDEIRTLDALFVQELEEISCPPLAVLEECQVDPAAANSALTHHLETCERCRCIVAEMAANHSFLKHVRKIDLHSLSMALGQAAQPDAIPLESIKGYVLKSELSRGAQAVVYEGVQLSTNRIVAIKMLIQGQFATRRQQERFQRSVEMAASLNHPSIVGIYDSGVSESGKPFCVMEYVDGIRLDRHLARTRSKLLGRNGQQSFTATLRTFMKICEAVHYVHGHGIIHRDLKPQNILLDRRGEPHVCDFGMATAVGLTKWTQCDLGSEGSFSGTLVYAAPEVLKGQKLKIGIRSDVYSLGVILYQIITGRLPHCEAETLSDMIRNVQNSPPLSPRLFCDRSDRHLEAIVGKVLMKDAFLRYESARALRDDVERWIDRAPVAAGQHDRVYRGRAWLWRNRRTIVYATIIAVLTAALIWTFVLLFQERAAHQELVRQVESAQTSSLAASK